jgi:hypothetical protein
MVFFMPEAFSYNFETIFEKLKFGFGWTGEGLKIFIYKKLGLVFVFFTFSNVQINIRIKGWHLMFSYACL